MYFSKFLTSPKLMGLQLRDPYFRRHMIAQILIFLQTATTERKGAAPLGQQQRAQADRLQCLSSGALEHAYILLDRMSMHPFFGRDIATTQALHL